MYVLAPPGPTEPTIVQRIRYLRDPLGYLDTCRSRYGDVFTLRLMKPGLVLVSSPELVKIVFTADDDTLAAGAAKLGIFGKVMGRSSSLLLDGATHVERRRLLLPRFRGELVQSFAPVMADACKRALDALPMSEVIAWHPVMHRIAFDVIAHALFSAAPPSRVEPLVASLREFANTAVSSRLLMFPALQRDLGSRSPWGRVLRAVDRAKSLALAEVRARRDSRETSDLTGLLLAAREDDSSLSDDEVRDEILTMVAAGHETTAIALTWLTYAVFTRPAIAARLADELATRRPLDELPYLDAVVRESLRFYSLIPNGSGRLAKTPVRLGAYDVPVGSIVSVAFHALHRRHDVFENADEFWPERFATAKYSPYELAPFGGGSRRCLGMPFALFEIKLVIAMILERFHVEIVQRDVRPAWRGAFLAPSKGLRVRLRRATAAAARA